MATLLMHAVDHISKDFNPRTVDDGDCGQIQEHGALAHRG
jgi:hypothetical protein